jgi:hypothetical protein
MLSSVAALLQAHRFNEPVSVGPDEVVTTTGRILSRQASLDAPVYREFWWTANKPNKLSQKARRKRAKWGK